jgi:putative heme-binding domain-containing protein
VRGYEPVIVDTIDGLTFNGFLKEDNQTEIILVTGDRKEIRIPRNDIEKMAQGTVSIMPAGLDQQLSDQELADLLEFLKTAR